jgi:hypothetical protein
MPASGQPRGDRCGKWMPRAKAHCGRMPGHRGECRTPAALAERRERLTERRRGGRLATPEARTRWNRAHKLKRFGLTPESFQAMLEAQGYACAMGREPFEEGQRICIDHDHACCPVAPGARARSCGKCVRGLLCLTCNVAVGYVETYSELVASYLETAQRPASPQLAGRSGLAVLRGGDGDGDPR